MQLGRAFLPEEDRPDRRREVILTHGLWMRRFGGDPQILGRVLRLSDTAYTVVGVLAREFSPQSSQLPRPRTGRPPPPGASLVFPGLVSRR